MSDFKKKLKALEKVWKGAKGNQEYTFKRFSATGKFVCRVHSAQLGQSRNEDNPRLQVTWDFRVVKGEHMNEHIMAWDGIETPQGLAVIKGRLEALKADIPDKLADLPDALDSACDTKCLVKVARRKGKGDFLNVTILKALKKKSGKDDSGAEAEGL